MATNLNYDVSVSTVSAVQSLERLQRSVTVTSGVFDKLKSAVAGLALGQSLAALYSYADGIDDIAKANGLAIETVLGFGKALEYNGGRADAAANGLATFTSNIQEAADGSAKLQDTFGRLGISLKDLGKLSEAELLDKVVEGFDNIKNESLKASLSTQLFGKALKGVELAGFIEDYKKYKAEQAANAPAVAAAAQASENFSRVIGQLQLTLLGSLKPISDLAVKLLDVGSSFKSIIKWVIDFGLAVAGLWAGFKVLQLIAAGALAIGAAFGWIIESASGIAGLFRVIFNPAQLTMLIKNLKDAGGGLRGLGIICEAIFGSIKAVANGLVLVAAGIYASWNAIKETFGWGDKAKKDSDAAAAADTAAAKQAREVQAAMAKKALEISRVSENFAKANAQIIDNINLENQLIGQSKEYADAVRAQEALIKRSTDEIDKLRDAKEALTAEEQRAGLGAKYDAQIAKIQQLTEVETARVKRATDNANRLQAIEQIRLFGIRNEIDKAGQLQTIQDDIAKSTMTTLEKKYYDIDAAAKASAKSAIDAEEARRNAKMPIEEQQKYYTAAMKGNAELKQAAEEQYNDSRKFSTGWNQAFNDYMDNAMNAAGHAQRIFAAFTQNMEDALFRLFKTGKLGWRDFVQSMIDALLKSQIQQLMANLMSGARGASGGGGLGKLLGFADGGIIPTNGPVIVGERGPEIISGAAGRTVTPNSQLGGSTTVTYNISAVDAQSFKQMIAADPTFLHAVAEQGRRSLPGSRR